MKHFLKIESGSVMLEYIIITAVFMLGVGGFCYLNSEYVNLLPGLLPGEAHSPFTIREKNPGEYATYVPVEESKRVIQKYGVVGNAFAVQTQKAQKVIAMPQL